MMRALFILTLALPAFAEGPDLTPGPGDFSPHGDRQHLNRPGSRAAGVAGEPLPAGRNQAGLFLSGGDASQHGDASSAELLRAETGEEYCNPVTMTGPEQIAACRIAAIRAPDGRTWAARSNLRQDTVATANLPAGKVDRTQKIAEAARISAWGGRMLSQRRHVYFLAAFNLVNPRRARLGAPPDPLFPPDPRNGWDDASWRAVLERNARDTRIQAALYLLAEADSLKESSEIFNNVAEFNNSGMRLLAESERSHPSSQEVGSVDTTRANGVTSVGNRPGASPAPATGPVGPSVFADRPRPPPPSSSGSPGAPGIAVNAAGEPGTLSAEQLEEARQLAYDSMKDAALQAGLEIPEGAPLTAGTIESDAVIAPEQLGTQKLNAPVFDRAAAEAAADRYLAINAGTIKAPERITAPPMEERPPLFSKASDLYRQFDGYARRE